MNKVVLGRCPGLLITDFCNKETSILSVIVGRSKFHSSGTISESNIGFGGGKDRARSGRAAMAGMSKVRGNIASFVNSGRKGNGKEIIFVIILMGLDMNELDFPWKGRADRFDFTENITVRLNGIFH